MTVNIGNKNTDIRIIVRENGSLKYNLYRLYENIGYKNVLCYSHVCPHKRYPLYTTCRL